MGIFNESHTLNYGAWTYLQEKEEIRCLETIHRNTWHWGESVEILQLHLYFRERRAHNLTPPCLAEH